ncbi:MAG: hypothetical protein IKV57_07490 [Clostridia bacterium]|nr:hypothetical protein [Clostridia bacterium]
MKKQPQLKYICGILVLAAVLAVTVLAASYDSSEDPIVSLSYLTQVFRPSIEKDYEEKIAALEAQIEALSSGSTSPSVPEAPKQPETTAPAEPAAVTYEVIEMKYGDCLFAAGAVDIMLRAGSAVCIAPDAGQGISDYTAGAEIYNGEALTKNHMCLIPRGDGRGIMATAQSVYIMVRGDYSLVKS